jgi:hypothetical protein
MILNDKPNCQVSRILMNPRPNVSDRSENDPPVIVVRPMNQDPEMNEKCQNFKFNCKKRLRSPPNYLISSSPQTPKTPSQQQHPQPQQQ